MNFKSLFSTISAVVLSISFCSARFQATIKPTTSDLSSVDIFLKSDVVGSFTFGSNFQIVVGIPSSIGAAPAPLGVPIAGTPMGVQSGVTSGGVPNITFNALNMPQLTMDIRSANGMYNYLFNFNGAGTAPVVFSNTTTEVKVLSIKFVGFTTNISNSQSLESYANGLAGSGQHYFYVETTVGGDLTNEQAPFYNSTVSVASNGGCGYGCASRVVMTVSNPLPLNLLSFDATKADDSRAELHWVTAQEKNVDRFEVERSADSRNWNATVSSVKSYGASDKNQSYTTYDNTPLAGINYYRLKMIDVDGAVTYSETRKLYFASKFESIVQVMKNPFLESTDIRIFTDVAQEADYLVTDAAGRTVQQGKWEATVGNSVRKLDLNGIAAGNYMLSVHGPSIKGQIKLTKQ